MDLVFLFFFYLVYYYNFISWDYNFVAHTSHVVVVNFVHKADYLQFNAEYEKQIEETFHFNLIFIV